MLGKLSRHLVAVFLMTLVMVIVITSMTVKPLERSQVVTISAINLVVVETVIWIWRRVRRRSPAGEPE